jgi:hypothetical protein
LLASTVATGALADEAADVNNAGVVGYLAAADRKCDLGLSKDERIKLAAYVLWALETDVRRNAHNAGYDNWITENAAGMMSSSCAVARIDAHNVLNDVLNR